MPVGYPNVRTIEQYNGLVCKSGLAVDKGSNEGECVEVKEISFNGLVLKDPYECDPTDTDIKCELKHSGGGFLEVPCECSLDGNTGYCSSIIGTQEYKEAVKAV